MKAYRLVVSASAGLFTYLVLVLFLGSAGIAAYRNLDIYREKLAQNVETLNGIGKKLDDQVQSLQLDPENTRLYSRELGYYAPGEKVLRFVGRPPQAQLTSPGSLLASTATPADRRPMFRAIAVCVSLFTLFVSLIGIPGRTAAGTGRERGGAAVRRSRADGERRSGAEASTA